MGLVLVLVLVGSVLVNMTGLLQRQKVVARTVANESFGYDVARFHSVIPTGAIPTSDIFRFPTIHEVMLRGIYVPIMK
jgi:hypothetical protein